MLKVCVVVGCLFCAGQCQLQGVCVCVCVCVCCNVEGVCGGRLLVLCRTVPTSRCVCGCVGVWVCGCAAMLKVCVVVGCLFCAGQCQIQGVWVGVWVGVGVGECVCAAM